MKLNWNTLFRNPKNVVWYEMERSGQFRATSWCWTAGERALTYKLHIVTESLDEHGFIFDNKLVEGYFDERFGGKTLEASCENIAVIALTDLCERLPNAVSITVSISGNPDATWLTARVDNRNGIRTITKYREGK